MSNYSRKLKRNKKTKKVSNPMKKIFEYCPVELNNNFKFTIEITSYNTNYFSDTNTFINSHGLLINDYKNYCNTQGNVNDVIEFIKDSVENNCYLHDELKKVSFKIEDDHIYFNQNGDDMDYINMGEFYIGFYRFNVCNSYFFIEDIVKGTQYMYYGD